MTYVDSDARAARFSTDTDLVHAELAGRTCPGAGKDVRFFAADYAQPLDVPDESMDLVISLFIGRCGNTRGATCARVAGCWPTPATATPAWPPWTPRCGSRPSCTIQAAQPPRRRPA